MLRTSALAFGVTAHHTIINEIEVCQSPLYLTITLKLASVDEESLAASSFRLTLNIANRTTP